MEGSETVWQGDVVCACNSTVAPLQASGERDTVLSVEEDVVSLLQLTLLHSRADANREEGLRPTPTEIIRNHKNKLLGKTTSRALEDKSNNLNTKIYIESIVNLQKLDADRTALNKRVVNLQIVHSYVENNSIGELPNIKTPEGSQKWMTEVWERSDTVTLSPELNFISSVSNASAENIN